MILEAKEKEGKLTGTKGALCRGREPIAEAKLKGKGENKDINGTVSFFYTPLGIFVSASVRGLEGGAYSMLLTSGGGKSREINTLYNKDGYAWCADVTGRITPRELSESKISLSKLGGGGQQIAAGEVKKCAK